MPNEFTQIGGSALSIAFLYISLYCIGLARGLVRTIDDLYLSRCLTFMPCRLVAYFIVSIVYLNMYTFNSIRRSNKVSNVVLLLSLVPLILCISFSEDESNSLHKGFGILFALICMLSGVIRIVERGLSLNVLLLFLFFLVGSVCFSKKKRFAFGLCEKGVSACMLSLATS